MKSSTVYSSTTPKQIPASPSGQYCLHRKPTSPAAFLTSIRSSPSFQKPGSESWCHPWCLPPENSITSRPGKLHQFSSGLLPSSPNRLPCFCPLCHFYFPDRSQAMLLRGKSDYVTLLDLHQWFPVSHGAKTQMLTAPGRLPKSWIHPPSPAPRNLLDQIFYCSQSCSRYAAATLAF